MDIPQSSTTAEDSTSKNDSFEDIDLNKEYVISSVLEGHTNDVRALTVTPDGGILSGSRDLTCRSWHLEPNSETTWIETGVFYGHVGYIACVSCISPTDAFPSGIYMSGGYDKKVLFYDPISKEAITSFVPHTAAVTSLYTVDNNHILTSSTDGSAKLWEISITKQTLIVTYHESNFPIWSVLHMNGFVLTAGADGYVRVYEKSGKFLRALIGHRDCVRTLAPGSLNSFYSGGNDGHVYQWAFPEFDTMQTSAIEDTFIYSMVNTRSGFVCSGENGLVYIRQSNKSQHIWHGCQSVWSVAVLLNTDIVTAGSDGKVRIFSQDKLRHGSKDLINQLKKEIKASKNSLITGIAKENSGVLEDVKQASNSKTSTLSFLVDLDDGNPPIKFEYRKGEDMTDAATNFLLRNNKSLIHLPEVIQFIRNNSPVELIPNNVCIDPLTGVSRYVPNMDTEELSQNNKIMKKMISHEFVTFDLGDRSKIKAKLIEVCPKIDGELPNLLIVETLMSLIEQDCSPSDTDIYVLLKALEWPQDIVFPVLDTTRLAFRQSSFTGFVCSSDDMGNKIMNCLMRHMKSDKSIVNKMLTFKIVTNMISHSSGKNLFSNYKDDIFEYIVLSMQVNSPTKPIQVSIASVLLNSSICFIRDECSDSINQLLAYIQEIIQCFTDNEAIYRIVLALDTLSSSSTYAVVLTPTTINFLTNHFDSQVEKVSSICRRVVNFRDSMGKKM